MNKDGTIGLCTARPFTTGFTVEEIKDSLLLMLEDVNTRPVIEESELPPNE